MSTSATRTRTGLKLLALAVGLTAALVLFFAIALPVLIFGVEKGLFTYIRAQILDRSGWNANLVTGFLILGIVPLFLAIRALIASWSPFRMLSRRRASERPLWRYAPHAVVVAYASGYFFLMFLASQDSNFAQSGEALKYCADTPEGFQCFDENVRTHPVYGMPLEAVTSAQVVNRKRRDLGQIPQEINIFETETIEFFDRIDGRPKVWYYQRSDGAFQIYGRPGRHPQYGAELLPIQGNEEAKRVLAWISAARAAHSDRLREAERAAQAEQRALADAAMRQAKEQEARETAEAVETRRARYSSLARDEVVERAVVIVGPNGRIDLEWTVAVGNSIGASHLVVKPTFVDDKLFARAFEGDVTELRSLGLTRQIKSLILGRRSVQSRESVVAGQPVYRVDADIAIHSLEDEGRKITEFKMSTRAAAQALDEGIKQAQEALKSKLMSELSGRL